MLTLGLGTAAVAQQNHDTQWRTKPLEKRAYAAKDADLALRNFAKCAVNRRFEHANTYVLAAVDSTSKISALRQLVMSSDDGCLYGFTNEVRLRFSPDVMSGALGQALTAKYYPDLPAILAARPLSAEEEAAHVAPLPPAEIFARCVVRRNPVASIALVASEGLSVEERKAIDALRPDLGPCLLAGSSMTINPLFLRTYIGIASYRLGVEMRPPFGRVGA
ncbi:hypothetical protein GKE62_04625 [Novosphingobium sp. Gsoil 351]|nr:hypothetical protein GKE62_04625 [Novosphingobium sp. Gsoil 351]